jgi:tol-pal system protein YbgF
MKRYKFLILAAITLLIAGASSPSSGDKELIIRLQGEVLVVQRQIRDLQESFDKWQGQSTASLQRLSDNSSTTVRELSSIEDALKNARSSQNNTLAGASSQLQRISEQLSRQDQSISNIEKQIDALRQIIQEQRAEPKEGSQSSPASLQNGPENLYTAGYGHFKRGDYQSAINHFRAYLNSNSQSDESDDALFWMAESLSSLARYNEALEGYDRILSEYPKGDKATQALLKKGITLLQLERRSEGVNTLRSLLTQYPKAQEAISARNELNRLGEDRYNSTTAPLPPQNRQRPE